jgi:hypothetical protein
VENLLGEAGHSNVGELAYRLLLVPDSINDIDGIGPSYIKQIESALEVMIGYQPLPEEFAITEEIVLEDESPSTDADEEAKGDEIDADEADAGKEVESEAEETDAEKGEETETETEEAESAADETDETGADVETDETDEAEVEEEVVEAKETAVEEEVVKAEDTEAEEEVAEGDPAAGKDENKPDTADETDAESNEVETETQDEE